MSIGATQRLGDVATVIAGQSPDGKAYNTDGRGMAFFQGKKEFGEKFIGEPTTWTTEVTRVAQRGDVLMSVRAPVGPVNFAAQECCIGRGLAAIRAGSKLNQEYLYYYLLSKRHEIEGTEGAVFASINKTQIEAIELPVTLLDEQQRIVGILDEAFAAIATAKANTDKNVHNARAVFDSSLHSMVAGAFESCKVVALAEIATDITDGDHLPPPKSTTGLPFVTIGNIDKTTRRIDFADTFMVPRSYYDALKPNRKPKRGDVLYTVTGSFGIPVVIDDDKQFCFQRHIGLIRPNSETLTAWLYYLMLSPQLFRQADDGATGTAQRTVSLKVLRSFRVPKLPVERQRSAIKALDALKTESDRLTDIHTRKLAALDDLKASLLHHAFTGQLTANAARSVSGAVA